MSDFIDFSALLSWVGAHPTWSGIAVFLISVAESLAIVGLFIPGTIVMFGIGALVAAGSMELWPTLAWAAAGAVVGDGMSYWLGRHYHMRLRVMWPFRSHPRLMARGVDFFHHHGGKSIFLGRFMGPVRPIIPAVAGMMDMSPWRFTAVNMLSALAWAPAYILPGVVFGASLGLAKEVASRLAVLAVLALGLLWLTLWLVHRTYLFLQPRAGLQLDRLMQWSHQHPWLGRVSAALVDPAQPESRGLLVLAALLVATAWASFTLLSGTPGNGAPAQIDGTAYHVLQGLRTPWADHVMVLLTKLGDVQVYLPVTLAVLVWLGLQRKAAAALHWLAAVTFGVLLVQTLMLALQAPPPAMYFGTGTAVTSPMSHEIMSIMVYGFLAVLAAKETPLPLRWVPYAAAALLVVPIALARLYLGLNWLSETLGGMLLGIIWIALLGIAYRRHAAPALSLRGLSTVALGALMAAGSWHVTRHYERDVARYALHRPVYEIGAQAWWDQDWKSLPAYRIDLRGQPSRHPLTLQWAGPLDQLRDRLLAYGWRAPTDLSMASSLLWLSPAPALAELPVLPVVHDGRHESLLLMHPGTAPDRRLVLRLWPADTRLKENGENVYTGNVSEQHLVQPVPLFWFPRTGSDFETPLLKLQAQLQLLDQRLVQHPLANPSAAAHSTTWQGKVLLLRQPVDCNECAPQVER